MHAVYLLSVWLHILAVAAWLGGALFLVLVLVPISRRPEMRGGSLRLLSETGRKFRRVGWICLGLLVATGIFNLYMRGYRWEDVLDGDLFRGTFGRTLGYKLILVSAVLLLSAFHDFVIGPRAVAHLCRDPGSVEAKRARHCASWFGRVTLMTGLAVVAFGVLLVRGWPW